jgi:hypothetical protein
MQYRTADQAANTIMKKYPIAGMNGSGYGRYKNALHEAYMAGFSDGVADALDENDDL